VTPATKASLSLPVTTRAAAFIGPSGTWRVSKCTLSERLRISGLIGSVVGRSMRPSELAVRSASTPTPTGSSRSRRATSATEPALPATASPWRRAS
jgi:hypothetical protein